MFEDVVNQINEGIEKRKKQQENTNPISFSISDIPSFNDAFFRERISNIDGLQDREIYDMLKTSYSLILEDIFVKESSMYLGLFTNTRFLTIFIQVINSVQISYMEQIYCNKLAYDYLTKNDNNIDEYTKSLFFTLSRNVNKHVIPSLLGLGLSEDFASYLALCRFSSSKEFVNIRRVNYLLISSSPTLLNEQMIIYIYEKLFDRFTDLFKYTMFDVYSDEELYNIGPGAAEVYSNISLAVIDILNIMTSEDIRKVLISYAGDYKMDKNTNVIRFSIKTLAVHDYKRIIDVVDYLESTENIFVP